MSSIGTGYDLSCTTYSPDGRLYQVEYAGKAVSNSGTAIGICCKDGVVLGVEKIIEYKMLEQESNRRIFNVDKHVGMAVAGYNPDCRQIVNKARSESVQYQQFYGSKIPGQLLCDRISSHVHLYTLYWHLRPFGSSVLLATYDNKGPGLYMIEPSGTSWGYHACAVGKGKQAAKAELEKLKPEEMTCVEAVKEISKIIYGVYDKSKDKDFHLELSWVCDASKKVHEMVPEDIREQAIKEAKDSLIEEDEDEEDVDLSDRL
eukprot:gene352-6766_t